MIPLDDLDRWELARLWQDVRMAPQMEPGRCPLRLVQLVEMKKRIESHLHDDDLDPPADGAVILGLETDHHACPLSLRIVSAISSAARSFTAAETSARA